MAGSALVCSAGCRCLGSPRGLPRRREHRHRRPARHQSRLLVPSFCRDQTWPSLTFWSWPYSHTGGRQLITQLHVACSQCKCAMHSRYLLGANSQWAKSRRRLQRWVKRSCAHGTDDDVNRKALAGSPRRSQHAQHALCMLPGRRRDIAASQPDCAGARTAGWGSGMLRTDTREPIMLQAEP